MADETPAPSAADDLATWTTTPPAPEPPGRGLSSKAKVAGIVGTAAVLGFVGVLVMQGGSSAATSSARGGFGGPPGGQQGGVRDGGFAARGLSGTVASVSSSSITVAGTTVKVTSATEVVVNGTRGALSDVTKGATVFVHTEGSGSSRFAERIFVGGLPQGGPGGFGGQQGGPGFGPPPDQSDGNGSTAHT
jgi:hypothetical protein